MPVISGSSFRINRAPSYSTTKLHLLSLEVNAGTPYGVSNFGYLHDNVGVSFQLSL